MAETAAAWQDSIQRFIAQVQQLQQAATQANPDGRSLQQQFLTLQQTAQQGVLQLALSSEPETDPTDTGAAAMVSAPTQSTGESLVGYQTEISRALRLLGMDITFLQSARQPQTQQKRQAQIRDRLERLQYYGQGILGQVSPEVGSDGV
jgi:hypothetical protein